MSKMNFYVQTKKRNGKRWITKAYFKARKYAKHLTSFKTKVVNTKK